MKYVAFFRGINVGGKNIVKMADLKQMFTNLGFLDVKTYIQSGNVIFSSYTEKTVAASLIAGTFEEQFGFQSSVIIRSEEEIANIVNTLPFGAAEIEKAENEAPDVEHVYIYLSDTVIDRERVGQLCAAYDGKDRLHVTDYEIYLLCFQSIRDSKLAVLLSKLPQPLTVRNLKTTSKIKLMLG